MIGWGIIGPGAIAHNFADGLQECPNARLVAIAGRSAARAGAFAAGYGVVHHPTPAALLEDSDVDAVYIAAPNAAHLDLNLLALAAGKAVLCEKPAGLDASEVAEAVRAARRGGLFWMEGYMYRLHPQITRLIDVIQSGAIGEPMHLRTNFGFCADDDAPAALWSRKAGGGAIMDVGGYPMSLARLIAGTASGASFCEPASLTTGEFNWRNDVETTTHATLQFARGFTAQIAASIGEEMTNSAILTCTRGRITLTDPWTPGREVAPSDTGLQIETADGFSNETVRDPRQLFAIEAEAASFAITQGLQEPNWPAMAQDDSLGNAKALDWWRTAVDDASQAKNADGHPVQVDLPHGH